MAPDQEVVRVLKAYVDTDEGMVEVPQGSPLPANAVDGEADRLRELGALGAPAMPPAGDDPGDEVTALTASLTEEALTDYVRDHNIKDILAAVGEDAELAGKVLAAEQDATNGEPRPTLVKALNKVIGEEPEAEGDGAGDDPGDEG